MSCRVHRRGVLEGVPDDNRGVLCVVQGSSVRSSGKSVFSFSLV